VLSAARVWCFGWQRGLAGLQDSCPSAIVSSNAFHKVGDEIPERGM